MHFELGNVFIYTSLNVHLSPEYRNMLVKVFSLAYFDENLATSFKNEIYVILFYLKMGSLPDYTFLQTRVS